MKIINAVIFIVLMAVQMLNAEMIDDFSYINNWRSDPSDKAKIINFGIREDSSGPYMNINYDFSTMDLTKGDAIKFDYRAVGNDNVLNVKLEDADGTVYYYKLLHGLPQTSWKTMILKYQGAGSDFILWGKMKSGADSYLDLRRIKLISFVIISFEGTGGSGTMWIDNLSVFQTTGLHPEAKVIDNFDDGNLNNNFNLPWVIFGSGGITAFHADPSEYQGTYCLKLNYNVTNNWGTSGPANTWVVYKSRFGRLDLRNYQCLSFYVKGSGANEQFSIKLSSSNTTVPQAGDTIVWHVAGLTKEWNLVQIDLGTMADRENRKGSFFTNVISMEITFETNIRPQEGTIWIDALKFEKVWQQPAGQVKLVDDFEDPGFSKSWNKDANEFDPMTVDAGAGFLGDAMRIDYTFKNGTYFALTKYFNLNFYKDSLKTIEFDYKGTGANNKINLKVVDSEDKVYSIFWPQITDTGNGWDRISFDLTDLTPWTSGSEDKFRLYSIEKMEFVILQTSEENKGTFALRNMQIIPNQDLVKKFPNYKFIKQVSFSQLPYDPLEDELSIKFILKQPADIEIYIMDSSGNMIYDFARLPLFNQRLQTGDYEVKWNGRNRFDRLSPNGLYFFQIRAKDDTDDEEYVDVLPVIR